MKNIKLRSETEISIEEVSLQLGIMIKDKHGQLGFVVFADETANNGDVLIRWMKGRTSDRHKNIQELLKYALKEDWECKQIN